MCDLGAFHVVLSDFDDPKALFLEMSLGLGGAVKRAKSGQVNRLLS